MGWLGELKSLLKLGQINSLKMKSTEYFLKYKKDVKPTEKHPIKHNITLKRTCLQTYGGVIIVMAL